MTESLDPRGYEVHAIGAPTPAEKSAHYLRRFWLRLPARGRISIFDRTWYGRVLVERVEKFAKKEEWQRAYHEINEFEKTLTDDGLVLVKFWIHISKKEQLDRFKKREKDPWKNWKLTDEDWRNREKWDAYIEALEEMFEKTDTDYAPWTIVEGNWKWFARIKALKTVVNRIEVNSPAPLAGRSCEPGWLQRRRPAPPEVSRPTRTRPLSTSSVRPITSPLMWTAPDAKRWRNRVPAGSLRTSKSPPRPRGRANQGRWPFP